MRCSIPDVLPADVVAVSGVVNVLGSAHGHMETQLGGLDKERRLIDYDTGLMVNGRGRGRGDDNWMRPAPDIDTETEIKGRGKRMGYGECGGNRQVE
jgi:hypothetical protein